MQLELQSHLKKQLSHRRRQQQRIDEGEE